MVPPVSKSKGNILVIYESNIVDRGFFKKKKIDEKDKSKMNRHKKMKSINLPLCTQNLQSLQITVQDYKIAYLQTKN